MHVRQLYQLLGICISSEDNAFVTNVSTEVATSIRDFLGKNYDLKQVDCIGPAEAYIYRIKNVYRRVIYIKAEKYDILTLYENKSKAMTKTARGKRPQRACGRCEHAASNPERPSLPSRCPDLPKQGRVGASAPRRYGGRAAGKSIPAT